MKKLAPKKKEMKEGGRKKKERIPKKGGKQGENPSLLGYQYIN